MRTQNREPHGGSWGSRVAAKRRPRVPEGAFLVHIMKRTRMRTKRRMIGSQAIRRGRSSSKMAVCGSDLFAVSSSSPPLGDEALQSSLHPPLVRPPASPTALERPQEDQTVKGLPIINGDSDAGTGLQFDGIRKQTTDNIKDNAGATLALSDLTSTEQSIVNVGGKPQAIVMGYREVQKFNELVLSSFYRLFQAGAGSMADIPAGISVTRWVSPFGLVDVIGSRYLVPGVNDIDENEAGENTVLVIDDKS